MKCEVIIQYLFLLFCTTMYLLLITSSCPYIWWGHCFWCHVFLC